MIIPELVRLYDRLAAEGDQTLAPDGYSRQKISFKVVLKPDGGLHGLEPVQVSIPSGRGGAPKSQPVAMLVPGQAKASGSGLNPGFLWDNAAYLLGFKADDEKPERTRKAFDAFRDRHLAVEKEINDAGFTAVARFLRAWEPGEAGGQLELKAITKHFGVFQICGELGFVHERPKVQSWWNDQLDLPEGNRGEPAPVAPSLVTGEFEPVARLHEPKIKGIANAQSAGALIVTFNKAAFSSYGKEQGHNAPVGESDAFKYCTALNRLTTDNRHRVHIGPDTYVFWTAGEQSMDNAMSGWFAAALDDSALTDERLQGIMEAVCGGAPITEFGDLTTPFYVLGLSSNNARLAVRTWLASTIGEVAERVKRHHDGLAIEPTPGDRPRLSIRSLVSETVPARGGFPDEKAINPTLASGLARSILEGTPYQRALFSGVLNRVRLEGLVDRDKRKDWRAAGHRRCAIIRACLTRNHRMEVPMALDTDRADPPYLLGRLFAVLEQTQHNALGDINRTIKDSYYGSASATPAAIFPRLVSCSRHHLSKMESRGQRIKREKELGSIMDRLMEFPRTLSMEAQGLFAIGYYHQRQSYFARSQESAS